MMNRRSFLRNSMALAGTAVMGAPRIAAGDDKASAEIPVLVLEGGPKARGLAYGEGFKEKIQGLVTLWQGFMHQASGMKPEEFVPLFLGNTDFVGAIKRWTPHVYEELEGIAAASGVDFDVLLAFNFTDEQWWFLRNVQAGLIELPEMKGCTALGAVTGEGQTPVVAQNMDIASGSEGFEVLLHIKEPETGHEELLFSVAGMPGIIGMNNAPVGLVNNSLKQLETSVKGLPVNCVVRGITAQRSYEDAVAFVKKITHASGQNYIIGGRDGVGSFECSANKVAEFTAPDFPGLVYHTNHPLVNDDTATFDAIKAKQPDLEASPSTWARCDAVEKRLKAHEGPLTNEVIKAILASQDNREFPISRPHNAGNPGATYTAASVIMDLGAEPRLHLAPGPPAETAFKTYGFG